MKKLLFVLACAASLGLWISCNNGAQDVNLKLDTGLIEKSYTNYGTATATKVTMVTKNTGTKVEYKDGKVSNKPTDRDDYYISTVQTLSKDGKSVSYEAYWFYNEWDAGAEVTFDSAVIGWNDNVDYADDGVVGFENVSNGKIYNLSLDYKDDVKGLCRQYKLLACGNSVKPEYNRYYDYQIGREVEDDFNTASFPIEGSLESNFTINASLKARDWCYDEYKDDRLDERIEYKPIKENVYNEDGYLVYDEYGDPVQVVTGYEAKKISADTSVYYLKDVKFTKN